jgi:hypothetical protein
MIRLCVNVNAVHCRWRAWLCGMHSTKSEPAFHSPLGPHLPIPPCLSWIFHKQPAQPITGSLADSCVSLFSRMCVCCVYFLCAHLCPSHGLAIAIIILVKINLFLHFYHLLLSLHFYHLLLSCCANC